MSPSDDFSTLSLQLKSTFPELERAVEEMEDFAATYFPDEENLHRVVLAISEAVSNSIEHGNLSDPTKTVRVILEAFPDRLEASVSDEGEGFDPSGIDNPLADENLTRAHGRGLFLMDTLADELHIEDQGRRVRMIFQRPTSTKP